MGELSPNLGFHIDKRGLSLVLVYKDGACRPASAPEVVLWDALVEATKNLAACYRISGADPDSNEDWRLSEHAVQAVTELRSDHDSGTYTLRPKADRRKATDQLDS
jgi:hypothetical protein